MLSFASLKTTCTATFSHGSFIMRRFNSSQTIPIVVNVPEKKVRKSRRGVVLGRTPAFLDLKSIEKYRNIYGNLRIPLNFEFDASVADVGRQAQRLGLHVKLIRTKYAQSINKDETWINILDGMGFVWNAKVDQFRLNLLAVAAYKEVFGDIVIPKAFVVPSESEDFPEDTWGIKLGVFLSSLRCSEITSWKADMMVELGVSTEKGDLLQSNKAEKVLEAIEHFKVLHGQTAASLRIPRAFTVPLYSPDWPKKFWGLTLGETVQSITRLHRYGPYHDRFVAAGVKLNSAERVAEIKRRMRNRNRDFKVSMLLLNDDDEDPDQDEEEDSV